MAEFVEREQPKPRNKIYELLLSPNGEYAVTWSVNDKLICGWKFNNQPIKQSVEQSTNKLGEQSENKSYQFEFDCLEKVEDKRPLAVSNNKYVAIGTMKWIQIRYINIEYIIDLATKDKINIELDPNLRNIGFIGFNNGDLYIYIVTYAYGHFIHKYSPKNLHKNIWTISNSISCGKDVVDCYLSDEKIMLLDRCGSLTQWNLNTLLFEKQYQLYAYYSTDDYAFSSWNCIFNKNSTLLAVNTNEFIYTYLTDNSKLLSQCRLQNTFFLSRLEFISMGGEERLLLIYNNGYLEIRSPYDLQYIINDKNSVMYDELSNEGMKPDMQKAVFKTLIDDKIYYISDEILRVQKVQWGKYLQKVLEDNSKISVLPIKSVIVEILQKYNDKHGLQDGNRPYNGSLVKWEIRNNNKVTVFLKNDFDWEFIDYIELFSLHSQIKYYNREKEIKATDAIYKGFELLHNEDLAIITSFGLFIWSIWNKFKKIRLRYYIYWDDILTESSLEKVLGDLQKHRSNLLPVPDFDFIIKNCEMFHLGTKERELFKRRYYFKELLDDYIENDDLLTKLYGHELLKACLKSKKYEMVEKLYNKFFYMAENSNFLEGIWLLDIFTFSFIELTQYPQFLREFLSYTLFIHPTNKFENTEFNKFFSEPHLQNHMEYLQPSFSNNIIELLQKLEEIEKKIQESTDNENKLIEEKIQKLEDKLIQQLEDNKKLIQEMKKILSKEEG
ncbi:13741_t:CDS:2 [Dentiscutata heterogama]|uniref:13741_t:CDS:1 n=1 Tax=Dentiscutata heterogama TaxID=1316150 RepID=A0ACA9K2S0_9GLOM|nr:13741_t:CDS:2 [Dentiscutata heterogama]